MRENNLISVRFEPDGVEISVPAGTLVSKAAAAAGAPVETPCGGSGTCGKCRVYLEPATPPTPAECRHLGEEELAAGVRLACCAAVASPCTVTIPETSRSLVQKILSSGSMRDCAVFSGVTKHYCELRPPSLEDEQAEFERLSQYLQSAGVAVGGASLGVLRGISGRMKNADYRVTATLLGGELIAVEEGDTSGQAFGIAFDLGSTTIVGYLMDLLTGAPLAVTAVMNPQMAYGDDLISRIGFATTSDDGGAILRSAAVDALNRIVDAVCESSGVSAEQIYRATVVGNTCMSHLLLGIDVASLGQSPYVPSVCKDVQLSASELGLVISPEAAVTVLPNVAGFVGSDLVGVLLAADWGADGRTRLAVDIGTNGEMALSYRGGTFACSAAAGPAFEGAGISCGMRGAPGAIDSVLIDEDLRLTTIDNSPAIGICGSGLVDAVAAMLDAGLIDEGGRLISPSQAASLPPDLGRRLVDSENGIGFVLVFGERSGTGSDIILTAADIRHLQLAKGSIHAAIQTLLRSAGASQDSLEEILLAGAFGNYIRVESAIRIGLIPAVSPGIVRSIGNAAGAGARLALLSTQEMERARGLARSAQHLELAVSADYQMELMERMMFPADGNKVAQ